MNDSLKLASFAIYALLVFVGGIIGFAKTSSWISLVSSSLSASLIYIAIWPRRNASRWSFRLALGVVCTLTAFFIYRFSGNGQIFPAGMMSLLGLLVLACQAYYPRRCASTEVN